MHDSAKVQQILGLLQKNHNKRTPLAERLRSAEDLFAQYSAGFDGLLMDYSRAGLDETARAALFELADAAGLAAARSGLFDGAKLNQTEGRPVLHHLWRSREFRRLLTDREAAECEAGLERMREMAAALHAGHLPGEAGAPVRDVIHVGIGGSLLGPRLLCEVFGSPGKAPAIHFVSSVDALGRERLLARLDPAETVVVLVSKSFTTSEVLAHDERLRAWQLGSLTAGAAAERRFAVTARPRLAAAHGVPGKNILPMGEWTGGRFSLWSPVGLTAAIAMGPDGFDRLSTGGAAMDQHFLHEPVQSNLPLLHGLLACWHRNVCGYGSHALAPYDSRLAALPAWLQQVSMESNGKSVTRGGLPLALGSAAVTFGECGTDAQHALFQAFHQGTGVVPLDFIGVIRPDHPDREAQTLLLSHMLAQATALAMGRGSEEIRAAMQAAGQPEDRIEDLVPHRIMPGNRPSTVLLLDRLDPETLGALLVLYEHSVFVQSVIWDINAFDQWGVELGKELCERIVPALRGDAPVVDDLASLAGLVAEIRRRAT